MSTCPGDPVAPLPEMSLADFEQPYRRGITKREYFAAFALQGLLTRPPSASVAEDAVAMADALMRALNRKRKL